ncbi:hypothetical protein J2Z31_002704 [Sinorhizobium kostiense]|uniref:Uncharacterized protein n=1 Tax=Sinorhizobium kostiense TaxID=76747 RepID=A0ABS4R1P3_9HYPH|nr:hypothetical protein [Sinorhizobium kostiense]MBP2236190.1 hypothetical protein [Sinorhizobium kostiense]
MMPEQYGEIGALVAEDVMHHYRFGNGRFMAPVKAAHACAAALALAVLLPRCGHADDYL